jgi:hypothetical protein
MPDQLLTFFSSLFNIHRSRLLKFEMISMMEDDDTLIAENNDAQEDLSSDLLHEFLPISRISFQIMYYQLLRGAKKTPLHTSCCHCQHGKSRSK